MNGSIGTIFGMPIVAHEALGQKPSDAEDARRIVRHEMADILEWLGEEVGPKPGEADHTIVAVDPVVGATPTLFVSREMYDTIRRELAVTSPMDFPRTDAGYAFLKEAHVRRTEWELANWHRPERYYYPETTRHQVW